MTPSRRVIWTQGMFLMPHHFQQEARHVDYAMDMRVQALGGQAWGFFDLMLDEGLLARGQLGLERATGILPDGTPFSIPQHDLPPAPLDVPADMKNELVFLALPRARSGVTQVDFDGMDGTQPFRWSVADEELHDLTHGEDEPESVQTGRLALRLLRAKDARDGQEGHALLGVARVRERRSDGQVEIDRDYIAPQTRIDASRQLSAVASLLHGLIGQRAQALAERFGQLSHGVSEMADFLMLQALNRAEPLFREHAQAPGQHPWALYRDGLQLAGDLATFTSEARHVGEFPLYRHDDLQSCFPPLLAALRRMLTSVMERNAIQIELERREHGVHVAVFPDADLPRNSNLVLAVNAQMPADQLRTRFTARSKLGPTDRLIDLVNRNLPGIAIRALPTAPRQLPFHAGFHYFELDRGGELWKQLERSGSLALHVPVELPSLELELWAVRQ
ncbi:type VI secretion system baseplate subunit TssK [Paucibacter sp. R3-3]|uniref:Type VI secretion system baseplate subunit TssK n=1 Tax=Roseateles agri TaxID=3098619 RepID=A0ABU5DAJ4_9BURK|nr:type VI secretion system baseplate subunit TssK [Paucibacter sp. R3-3]MDY0743303.1 type VI secretion system baseplate subunit TssK [Paucibacter sp. R3-3]